MICKEIKRFLLLPLLIWGNLHVAGQDIAEVDESELTSYTITRNETFDGPSLWGYMNGGADIYLEYGFEILRVQEFEQNDEKLKMEIFKMDDPLSAFGIYSIKIFRCKESPLLSSYDCLNPYQYQLLHGNYYIQIINGSGSGKAKAMMTELAGTILQKFEAEKFVLPATWLADSLNISPAGIKLLKGSLGIQNKAPELEGYFDGFENYRIYYARTEKDGQKQKYYEIVFDDHAMKKEFREENILENFRIIGEDSRRVLMHKIN